MKKKLFLTLFSTQLLLSSLPTWAREEIPLERISESSSLLEEDDSWNLGSTIRKLGLALQISTCENPDSNNWNTYTIPIDSKVEFLSGFLARIAYLKNVDTLLPQGYVLYSDENKVSTIALDLPYYETHQGSSLSIFGVPDLSFSEIQKTMIQFKGTNGMTYSLPLKENSYHPVALCKKGDRLDYTINLDFSAYQADLEALTGDKVWLNGSLNWRGWGSFIPDNTYQIHIEVLGNGQGVHSVEQDWNEGVPIWVRGFLNEAPQFPQYHPFSFYNRENEEQFFSIRSEETDQLLMNSIWKSNSLGGTIPSESDFPVYRLYNPNTQTHHFTQQKSEYDALLDSGWQSEGIGFYSANPNDKTSFPVYRLYNPRGNHGLGTHFYTPNQLERNILIQQGWRDEGIAWNIYEARSA